MTTKILTVACVVVLLGSLLGGAALYVQTERLARGRGPSLPSPSMQARPEDLFGINVDLYDAPPAERDGALATIAATGFGWVRQPFRWDRLQPGPADFDWEASDALVETIAHHNLQLIAVLRDSPAWARPSNAGAAPTAPPDDPEGFAGFAAAFAERYGDRVAVYEIWDEPNLGSGWGGQPPNAAAYARLLAGAHAAIHTADPEAVVMLAGLAPTTEAGPMNLSDVLFLRQLYEQDAHAFFDAVAAKPYGFSTHPADREVGFDVLNFSRMILLREEMEAAGDGDTLLWASNFGWNSLPPDWTGRPSVWDYASDDERANRTQYAFERARMEWPWAGVLVLENYQPAAPLDDPRWGFALVGADGTRTQTLDMLADALPKAGAAMPPGRHRADTRFARYEGEWAFSELGADIPESGPASVTIEFDGTEFGLLARRDEYRAYLYVQIDGRPANALPVNADGEAYAVLTSGDYRPHTEVIWLARDLPPGRHTATIRAERGWDQWAFAGFVVANSAGIPAPVWTFAALALLALASLTGLGYFGRRSGSLSRLRDRLRAASVRAGLAAAALLAGLAWVGAWLTWGTETVYAVRRYGDNASLLVTALAAGVFYFSPWLVVTLLSMVGLFILLLMRPEFALPLIAFLTPFYLLPRPLFERAFSLVEVVVLMAAAALALHLTGRLLQRGASKPMAGQSGLTSGTQSPQSAAGPARRERALSAPARILRVLRACPERSRRVSTVEFPSVRLGERALVRFSRLDWAVCAFAFVSLVSTAFAANRAVAVTELRTMVAEPIVVYALLRLLPLGRRDVWRTVDFWILGGVLVAAIGLVQYFSGTNLITAEGGVARLRSVYGSPNNVGLYLGRLLPIAVAIALMGTHRWRRSLYALAALGMAAALALSLSRGALLLGVPAALATVLLFWQGRRAAYALAGLAGAGLLALLPLSRHPRFAELLNLSTGPTFFRLNLWRSALSMIRDHPLVGVGLDNFLYEYRGRYILPAAWQDPSLSHAHNWLLDYAARLGLPGLAVALWLLFEVARTAWRAIRRARDPDVLALGVGLLASLVDFLAHGLVDASYWFIDLAFAFMFTAGLMSLIREYPEK